MKILFICGSMEPGKDGVGDYTRRLVGELVRQRHEIFIIALYDQFVQGAIKCIQKDGDEVINILRISSQVKNKSRFSEAQEIINDFDPEWISLQFVSFSFHSKGLPFFLGSNLKRIAGHRKWHIMFHELWVGMSQEDSLKYKLWGYVQRKMIGLLIDELKTKCIHTQTNLYQLLLSQFGHSVKHLPLFSNIPNYNCQSEQTFYDQEKKIIFVIFGSIHEGAPLKLFIKEVYSYVQKSGDQVIFQFLGRCGKELDIWVDAWKKAKIPVEIMYEQSEECISNILNDASVGITTTPLALTDKSGSVAAMRAHNLPVLCVARAWTPRGVKNYKVSENIEAYRQGKLDTFLSNIEKHRTHANDVNSIAMEFINGLLETI